MRSADEFLLSPSQASKRESRNEIHSAHSPGTHYLPKRGRIHQRRQPRQVGGVRQVRDLPAKIQTMLLVFAEEKSFCDLRIPGKDARANDRIARGIAQLSC